MKSIIFDLDGTIIQSEEIHLETFNKLFKNCSEIRTKKEKEISSKIAIRRSQQVTHKALIHITKKDWGTYLGMGSKHIITNVFKKYGIKISKNEVLKLSELRSKYFKESLKQEKVRVVKGFRRFYNMLKKRKVKIIVASSGQEMNVKAEMKAINLVEEFVHTGHIKKLKPNPEIFLIAAKKLKEKPVNCIVFEDAKAGVKAAKKAGMECVALLTGSTKKSLSEADHVFKDYTQITAKKLDEMLKI